MFSSRICNKHLLWYIVLLFVPPIPLLINPTSGQKKRRPKAELLSCRSTSQYDQTGLVGLSNTRLAKSHVEMSCKLFCLWLLIFYIISDIYVKHFNFVQSTQHTRLNRQKSTQRSVYWPDSPLMVWAPLMVRLTVSDNVRKHTTSNGQSAVKLTSVSL